MIVTEIKNKETQLESFSLFPLVKVIESYCQMNLLIENSNFIGQSESNAR